MTANPELSLTVGEIAKITGGITRTGGELPITRIVTDSKDAKRGDLFLALQGERTDGELYADEAIAKGAVALSRHVGDGRITVADVKDALLRLGGAYRLRLPNLRSVIAVTGSVGKTTTKEFLAAVLAKKYHVFATEKNHNNEIGVPMTVLAAPSDTEILILETGMNHRGEIAALSDAVRPDMALITNIGTAHIGNLGSREMIAEAKKEILVGMRGGPVLVPAEEPLLATLPHRVTVSSADPGADFFLLPTETNAGGSCADFYHGSRTLRGLSLPMPGRHLLNALAFALSAAVLLGLSDSEICDGISLITKDKVRQSCYKVGKLTIFDDAYNASPESMLAAIGTLDVFSFSKKSALIGDMLELGAKTEESHRALGEALVRHGFSDLYLFGVYAPFTAAGARALGKGRVRIFENTDPLAPEITAKEILAHGSEDEILLVKGSRGIRLERIIEVMKEITEGKTDA